MTFIVMMGGKKNGVLNSILFLCCEVINLRWLSSLYMLDSYDD